VVRVERVDREARDAAPPGDRQRAGDERPVVAAVRGLVEADAGLAVAAAVRLAGADVDRLAGLVARVDQDRADGVRRDVVGDVLPVRVACERVGSSTTIAQVVPVMSSQNRADIAPFRRVQGACDARRPVIIAAAATPSAAVPLSLR
jgi:hypothetical protein